MRVAPAVVSLESNAMGLMTIAMGYSTKMPYVAMASVVMRLNVYPRVTKMAIVRPGQKPSALMVCVYHGAA
jgi:hypothetical protein